MDMARWKALGALVVSSLLLVGGASMALNAGQALLIQFAPGLFIALGSTGLLFHDHSHVHDHETEVLRTNMYAAWLAAGSIFAKEWLYMTSKVAGAPNCCGMFSTDKTDLFKL